MADPAADVEAGRRPEAGAVPGQASAGRPTRLGGLARLGGLGTVRVRATAGAVLVVGIALLTGSVALVALLRGSLTSQVRAAGELRAAEIAAQLRGGGAELTVADEDAQLIQVLGGDGAVVAASRNLAGQPPLARLRPGEAAEVAGPDGDDSFLAVAAATADGASTVLVATALDDVEDSTQIVAGLLAAGVPLLLAVVAVTTWRVVGRALAPVDAIRREVESISGARLHRRVPEPAGGDEIARLAATMNRMLARIEDSLRRQRRFVSDASHELRSPVASIRQHAEVAAAHPGRTTVAELAATVLADALRLQHLVTDLLALAGADEQRPQRRPGPVDLDDLVFEQAARLRDRGRVSVHTSAVSAGRVSGDPASLRRLVGNLADNAEHHARSRVAFGLREHAGEVILHVDDDGPGVPASDRQRIFERFVRLDGARTARTNSAGSADSAGGAARAPDAGAGAGGAGLGLAIVAAIVAAAGGSVAVTDAPIGGARFEVRLPLRPD